MKLRNALLCSTLFVCQPGIYAYAQSPADSPAPPATSSTQPVEATEKSAESPAPTPPKLGEREVPRLNIKWDCGACTPNDKVPPLLEVEYAQEAVRQGHNVSGSVAAEVSIVEFRQRPPAMRALFGIMAGRDILKVRVTFRGMQFIAEDYMANIAHGMNSVCENVAKKALKEIMSVVNSK